VSKKFRIRRETVLSTSFIHLANLLTSGNKEEQTMSAELVRQGRATTLETFWKKKNLVDLLEANPDISIFLDSGAHSLLNAQAGLIGSGDTVKTERTKDGKPIFTREEFQEKLSVNDQIFYSGKAKGAEQMFVDFTFNENEDVRTYLDDYIAFIHKYKEQLTGYVNLDIIYNAEQSWKNQQYMEDNGLRPIPVFHYGEDFKWLRKYVDEYEYIGIGGVAGGITLKQFVESLGDKAFEYISQVNPDIKIHGFAVTSLRLMKRYTWTSVDSTTWLKHAAYGNVMVPKKSNDGKFDYSKTPMTVSVSDVSLIKASKHPHYSIGFTAPERKIIEEFFELAGVDSEKLLTDPYERKRVNIYYYEQVLKDPSICVRKNFGGINSFF